MAGVGGGCGADDFVKKSTTEAALDLGVSISDSGAGAGLGCCGIAGVDDFLSNSDCTPK